MDKFIPTLEEEFEASKKEIAMWREEFIKNALFNEYCLKTAKEDTFIRENIRNAPIGIEDIEEFIEKELNGYRETREKNS